ncbi:DUF4317 family protein, partial [bacterium]|nr:DUF4317 family protein [bacterium]
VYDIPGVTNDGIEMEDASDKIYDYILCSICPVKLSKAGLGYNESKNVIEDRYRDWVVEGPTKGFLFPAFIERDTDIHNMLYFTKKPDDLQPEFVEAMFGGRAPISAPEQKDIFDAVVQNTIGEDADYDIMKNIHDNLNDMIEDKRNQIVQDYLKKQAEITAQQQHQDDIIFKMQHPSNFSELTPSQLEEFKEQFMKYPLENEVTKNVETTAKEVSRTVNNGLSKNKIALITAASLGAIAGTASLVINYIDKHKNI